MNSKYIKLIAAGMVAGALIACSGAASYLAAAISPILKPAIFPIGLLLICYGKFALFTGNVYKLGRDDSLPTLTKINLLVANYISNLIGVFLVAFAAKIPADEMVQAKLSQDPWTIFFSAIACNFLVCLGVKLFTASPIATYGCVFLFVQLGFEHSIADMYYFLCAPSTDPILRVLYLLIITSGNLLGGWLIITIERIMENDK